MTETILVHSGNIPAHTITSPATQAMWLPKDTGDHNWEQIERILGVTRTGHLGGGMQSECEVLVPADWRKVGSGISVFQLWLIDKDGLVLAKIFNKDYRADFIELVAQPSVAASS